MKDIFRHLPDTAALSHLKEEDLEEIRSRGLAHDHIKLGDSGWLLRIPRGNQLGMKDKDYLDLQASIYRAMEPSGATPRFLDSITPCAALPHGALIIEYIDGRAINSENDLQTVAECLGNIHKLPVPKNTAPIEMAPYPFAGQEFLLKEVFKEAFNSHALPAKTRKFLCQERDNILEQIDTLKTSSDAPLSLIGGDSHLGNYLIDKNGKAWLVDLEFAAYDMALIDLADASQTITAALDPGMKISPSAAIVEKFYTKWKKTVGNDLAEKLENHIPLAERIVRLRTLAWLGNWVAGARAQEKDKVSADSLKNWDKMAKHYLKPKNLSNMFNEAVSIPHAQKPRGNTPKPRP